ncbi:hypothetical protein [Devosia sp. A16]|uniref:hypothetical protein n=1 Tax=Devosia sp. A16 TaxID=1736675 RepID=UPI0006D85F57|nr:hypothetical protein [Devosia sp. A16]
MVGVPFNPRQPTGLVDTSHAAANAAQDPLLSLYLANNGFEPAGAKPDFTENLARAAGQGLTFGWGDELLSFGQAGLDQLLHGDDGKDFWQRYDSNVARERRNLEAFRQENPIAAYGAEILGSLPTAFFTGGAGTATGLGRIGTNLLVNGIQGAVYGAGSATGDTLADRGWGALIGAGTSAGTGVLLDGATGVVGQLSRSRAATKADAAAPKSDGLGAMSKQDLGAAKSAGVQIKPIATTLLRQDLDRLLADEGMLVDGELVGIYDKVRDAMGHLDQLSDKPMTFKAFDLLERSFREAARSPNDEEAKLGKALLQQLDQFPESLPQNAFSGSGDGIEAATRWRSSINLRDRQKRTKMVEEMIDSAKRSGSFAKTLHEKVVSLLDDKTARGLFSDTEIKQMERFAQDRGALGGLMQTLSGDGVWGAVAGAVPGALTTMIDPYAGLGAAFLGAAAGAPTVRTVLNRGASPFGKELRASVASGNPPTPTNPLDLRWLAPGLGNTEHVREPLHIIVRGGTNSQTPPPA